MSPCPRCQKPIESSTVRHWMTREGKNINRIVYYPCLHEELRYKAGEAVSHEDTVKIQKEYE